MTRNESGTHSYINGVELENYWEIYGLCNALHSSAHMRHLGFCGMDYDNNVRQIHGTVTRVGACPARFEPIYSRRWQIGRYQGTAQCSLGCSDENLFGRGADQATCLSNSQCSQRCALLVLPCRFSPRHLVSNGYFWHRHRSGGVRDMHAGWEKQCSYNTVQYKLTGMSGNASHEQLRGIRRSIAGSTPSTINSTSTTRRDSHRSIE